MADLPSEGQLEQFLHMLRGGSSVEAALDYLSISIDDYDAWMEKGRSQVKGKHEAFYTSVTKAMAEADLKDMAIIQGAAQESWQAAAARIDMRRQAEFRESFRRLRELTT